MQDNSYYWASVEPRTPNRALSGEQRADLVVVGGGLTGLSAALEAAGAGLDVVILEAEHIGFGASGRNGGLLCPGFAVSPEDFGVNEDTQRGLWRMACDAIDLLHHRRKSLGIDCDWQSGYFMSAGKNSHMRELADYHEELEALGYGGTRMVDRDETQNYVGSPVYKGGLFDPHGGHLHPLKYTLGLAREAERLGVRIYEGSAVTGIESNQGKHRVVCAGGSVAARHCIVANNAYATGLLPRQEQHILPVATLIVATEPLEEELALELTPGRACVDESYNILNYYHLTDDNRMLFGGRSNYNGRIPNDIAASVRPRMEHVYPQLKGRPIEHAWGGHVAITIERTPHVGRTEEGVLFAQGFSGQGLALTGQVGKVLTQAVLGEQAGFDLFAALPHRAFPGGKALRVPLQVLGMLYYRLQDMLP